MEKNPMLEPEYIDRKKLLGKQKSIDGEPYVRLWDVLMTPVEDVQAVVRCGKCVFRYCTGRCAKSGLYMNDDGFCSFGREDGDSDG